MSILLKTHSKLYYGYIIDQTNYLLDFKEGAPELTAELNFGEYSFTDFAVEIKRALDDAGALTYTVTANRTDRTITIATASSNFSLLVNTGSHVDSSPWLLIGFTGADLTGAHTYTGNDLAGSEYKPQFWLQNYISSDDWQQAANASVNLTASGRVEVIKFGIQKFVQFQIKYINEFDNGASQIRNDEDALDNARAFLQYVMRRSPFEFMADEDTPSDFETLTLDSTPDSSTGTGYKLKELYDQNLPGYFETAVLKFRVRED